MVAPGPSRGCRRPGACSSASGPNNGQNSLRPKGQYSRQVDNLFTPIMWVAVAVGVFIIAAVLIAAIRFRHRPGSDDRPKQTHGNIKLEIGWTLVPLLVLAVIAVPTVSTIFSLAEKPSNPVEITVVAKPVVVGSSSTRSRRTVLRSSSPTRCTSRPAATCWSRSRPATRHSRW